MRLAGLLVASLALLLLGAAPAPDRCASLKALALSDVEIESADASPSLCRVRGVARPSADSHIVFELWLPEAWNGRYYQIGNGGFAGSISRPTLAAEAARGNAVAATDTGHSGDGFDASWAEGHPERVVDYGYRSIKATSDAARALVTAYYGRPARYRYFTGCSNGGRQALMAAQRYPEDWDGILAGAPANMWTAQFESFATLQRRLRAPGNWLPPSKLPAIQRAALAGCPPRTVRNGIATDPRQCRFDPASLLCRGAVTDACLTRAEAASVAAVQAAGFEATGALPDNWSRWIVNPDPAAPSQLTFGTQAERFILSGERPATLQHILNADAVDYRRFASRNGRILSYFGWADAVISPSKGIDYYRRVAGAMGPARTLAFYRLFTVPGMTHCQGGAGPDAFGQSPATPGARDDARRDARRALEAWVELGRSPNSIIATSAVGDQVLRPLPPTTP